MTLCKELTHWKRPWCWEGLGAGGEGDNRGWDGWMASPTRWTWVWVISGSWWWTGRPGMLRFMGSQRVGHDWATELNWYVSHMISIHSSGDALWSCFRVLAVVNSATVNIGCMYLFEVWFSLSICPGVGFLGHMIMTKMYPMDWAKSLFAKSKYSSQK